MFVLRPFNWFSEISIDIIVFVCGSFEHFIFGELTILFWMARLILHVICGMLNSFCEFWDLTEVIYTSKGYWTDVHG